MTKLTFAQQLFSITNSGSDKLITILGIPIRIDRSNYYKKFCQHLEIDKNKIVFCNFNGNGYGCNPKYIAREIIKRKLPYKLVWLTNDIKTERKNFPSEIELIGYGTKDGLKELATAKIWIDNQRKNYFIKKGLQKKEGQIFIQTWHGALGIKKLDADVIAFTSEDNQDWVKRAIYDSSTWDYLLTNSSFENKIFPHALWFNNELKEFGHPRNDIFFENSNIYNEKIKKYYGIPQEKKIVLYVPSFRDNGNISCYKPDYNNLLKSLTEKFDGEWICITRLHPRTKKFDEKIIPKNKNIIDGTFYPDIQELLVSADVVITDYSSCIFDFMLSRKPAFIFAPDIENFDQERGFYYPLTSTPFPVAQNSEELSKNILDFDYETYKQKVEKFLNDKGCIEDGHASERVVDLIETLMNK